MSTVTGTGAIALLLLIGLAVGQRGSMRTDTEIASINAPDPAELAPAGLDPAFQRKLVQRMRGPFERAHPLRTVGDEAVSNSPEQ